MAQLVPVSSFKVYGVQKFAGVNGQPRTVTNFDYREFQPRIGFAYQLTKRTVIRGGIGRFVDASLTRGGQNGFSSTTSFIASRDNGLTPYDSLANPFRNGILEPTGSSLGPLTNLGQGVNWINQDPKRAYSWEYSLHIQHQLKSWLLEAGYTHNKTYDIGWGLNQNLFGFDQWLALRAPRFDATGRPLDNVFTSETVPNPFQNLVSGSRGTSSTISIFDLLRPLKVLGDQNRDENPWGKNQYDALEAKAQKRFARGYSVIASYTFSKLFEDTSFWGPEISGPITEHKLGGEDRPHRLSFATIIELPLGRHKKYFSKMPKFADYTLGGWELTGQYTLQSGVPVVFNNPANFFFDGQDFTVSGSQQTLDRWFDTSHFFKFPGRSDPISIFPAWTGVQNLPGASYVPSSSNDPMNGVYHDFDNYVSRLPTRWAHVRASNVNELNLGLYKNFRLSESLKVQVRGEAFNALNHPRFPAPNGDPGSSSFGKVSPTQQNQARVIQLAVKLSF